MKKISNIAKKLDILVRFFKGLTIVAFIFAAILLFALLGLEDSVWADMAFETKLSFVFQYGQELQIQSDETL